VADNGSDALRRVMDVKMRVEEKKPGIWSPAGAANREEEICLTKV
jgi:hypothetical protein